MHSVNELLDGCLWHITVNVEGLSNHHCLYSPSTSVFFSLICKVQTLLSLILLFPPKIFAFLSHSDFHIHHHISIHLC